MSTLVSPNSDSAKLPCFEADENIRLLGSCSVVWQDKVTIFGGFKNRRQVLKLNNLTLERTEDLDFDHVGGGCTVMNNEHLFLCFNSDARQGYILELSCEKNKQFNLAAREEKIDS